MNIKIKCFGNFDVHTIINSIELQELIFSKFINISIET